VLNEKQVQADIARLQAELANRRHAGVSEDRRSERTAIEIDELRADLRRMRQSSRSAE
jgi:hypothetical protein